MAGIIGSSSLCICFQLSLYVFILLISGQVNAARLSSPRIDRSMFPKDFKFGAATSAYQVEGATHDDGKGPSIWDIFSHLPGKIVDGENGDVAADQYHRYKEDVQLLKYMGMDVYRFSISWSRIYPFGSPRHGKVNPKGIAHYNNLINELLKNDIEPFVTLYHNDLPEILENEYRGFLSKRVVEDFGFFVEECFRAFGDRVKYWTTINEPSNFAYLGYDMGVAAPGRCSAGFGNCISGNSTTEPYIVAHNLLLAHSIAVKIYKTKYQGKQNGSIGIPLLANWMVPFSNSLLDQMATQRVIDFRIGCYKLWPELILIADSLYPTAMEQGQRLTFLHASWIEGISNRDKDGSSYPYISYQLSMHQLQQSPLSMHQLKVIHASYKFLDPLTSGKYPDSMRRLVGERLPRFTSEEAKELKGSFDFIGLNYYTTYFTINNPHPPNPRYTDYILDARANVSYEFNGVYIGSEEGVSTFRSYPPGIRELVSYIKHRYNSPPMYITESGYADYYDGTIPLEQTLNDLGRVKYHSDHLSELLQAISEGADIRGYIVWECLDEFEWGGGYNYRFGLNYVDRNDNLKRYPRASAKWFKKFLLEPRDLSSQIVVWEGEQWHQLL